MTENTSDPNRTDTVPRHADQTDWRRLAEADPIRIRDPLAEVLGMVTEGEPLVVTFEDAAKAAGHACPAVAGAYRGTQLALEELYPDGDPVRSTVGVVVGGDPEEPGLGPMANVVRLITGAADETGFAGFGGYGGRDGLLSFGDVDAPGRAFRFERTDVDRTVVVSFDPASIGVDPAEGGGAPMRALSSLVAGDLDDEEAASFRDAWHDRVQRILNAPADGGPFSVVPGT